MSKTWLIAKHEYLTNIKRRSFLFGAFGIPIITILLMTMVFGLIIGLVSCFQGMNARGGTEGVERAATSSVVLASLLIILADVLLVRLILVIWG